MTQEFVLPNDQPIEQLLDQLPEDHCRYIYIDFTYDGDDKRKISKTIFVTYTPDKSSVQEKARYASTKASFLKVFHGAQVQIQADSKKDVA